MDGKTLESAFPWKDSLRFLFGIILLLLVGQLSITFLLHHKLLPFSVLAEHFALEKMGGGRGWHHVQSGWTNATCYTTA